MKYLTRAKGGALERRVLVSKIKIPDLWKVTALDSKNIINAHDVELIRETWVLCHDMLRELRERTDDDTGSSAKRVRTGKGQSV